MHYKYVLAASTLTLGFALLGAGCSSNTAVTTDSTDTSQNTLTTPPSTSTTDTTPVVVTTTPSTTSPSSTAAVTPASKPSTVPTAKVYVSGVSGVTKNNSMTTAYNTAFTSFHGSSYYMQLTSCHGSPGFLSLKAGARFMLDNRDSKSHRLTLGNVVYSLPAYGYVVTKAPSLVGTFPLTCDGGGAANINIEK